MSAQSISRRLFLCDPVCASPHGHNVTALESFAAYFSSQSEQVEALGSESLDRSIATDRRITRHFRYLYGLLANIESSEAEIWAERALQRSIRLETDAFVGASMHDFSALIRKRQIGPNDIILLPSADFYGVMGVLQAIEAFMPSHCPKVYLRFVGVMENANHISVTPLADILDRIAQCLRVGYPINVSAETPIYARYLTDWLQCDVVVIPYPPKIRKALPLSTARPFTIFSAGSARSDKGWKRLLPIIARVRRASERIDTRFLIQVPTDHELARDQGYASQLYATPGVELLASSLSAAEMLRAYTEAHAVILPYDAAIYRLRGSATFMEAIAYGRFVFATANTGFSEQVSRYNAGSLCTSDDDFASAIVSVSASSFEKREEQMHQARKEFLSDADAAYGMWI